MEEKSYVTYEDVVKFYKDETEWPYYTEKLIEEGYGQNKSSNGYLNVADVFFKRTLRPDGNKSDDELFYCYLMEKKENKYEGVASFKDFRDCAEISRLIEEPEMREGKGIKYPSQKWHFYVAYIAYREAASEVKMSTDVKPLSDFGIKFDYYDNAGCPELILWMAETALGSKKPEVKRAYEIVKESKTPKEPGGHIDRVQTTCKKIREIIPWACIEEKMKSQM